MAGVDAISDEILFVFVELLFMKLFKVFSPEHMIMQTIIIV